MAPLLGSAQRGVGEIISGATGGEFVCLLRIKLDYTHGGASVKLDGLRFLVISFELVLSFPLQRS